MKTVLITGGSRGIGRAMVELFANNGYSVAFTYNKSEEQAQALARATGALAIKADSASAQQVLAACNTALSSLGHIDCLINNAAVSAFSTVTDISDEDWDEMIRVNLTSPFLYSRNIAVNMISRKFGRIINISSMWGLVGSSCEVHYSAAKSGLIGMTKAMAKELGPSGITVNAIAPGLIDTDMNRALDEDTVSAICDETPLCRMGTPREIAEAALFLASDKAAFITGAVLNVSGGLVV